MYDIILPRSINNYVVIGYTLLEVYIAQSSLTASLISVKGRTRKIVNFSHSDLPQRVDQGIEIEIARLLNKMIVGWKYHYCRLIITANNALFKLVSLPLFEQEKLKLIVPTEIEQSLPFSLSDCSVDSIVVKKNDATQQALLLAAVVKNEVIAFYREIFTQASIKLHALTIDVMQIISYEIDAMKKGEEKEKVSPERAPFYNAIVMLFNYDTTVFWVYKKGILVAVKVMDESVAKARKSPKVAIKKQSTPLVMSKEESLSIPDPIIVKMHEHDELVKSDGEGFVEKEVSFEGKIQGFIEVLLRQYQIEGTPVMYWMGISEAQSVVKSLGTLLKVSLQEHPFALNLGDLSIVLSERSQEIAHRGFEGKMLLIASFLSQDEVHFNLLITESIDFKKNLIKRQSYAIVFFTILFIALIIGWNWREYYKRHLGIRAMEQELITLMKKEFQLSSQQVVTIEKAMKESEGATKLIESMLPPMAIGKKNVLLTILMSIIGRLSSEIRGLQIESMQWKNGVLENDIFVIKGKVADFNSLHLLEKALRDTGVFLMVPQAQDPKFSFTLSVIKSE